MRKRERILAYVAPMVLALVFLALSLRMEYFSSKILPLVMGGFCIVICAIGIGQEILAKPKSGTTRGQDETASRKETEESWSKYAVAGTWVVGFFLAIYLLGFIIAIPLFILSYMKARGTKWLTAITFSIATGAFVYLVFVVALELYFYEGLISPYLRVPTIHFR